MNNINPVAFRIGQLDIKWYALILTSAMLVALCVLYHYAKKRKFNGDFILEIFLWTIPLAILFARLGFVLPRKEFYPIDSWQALGNYLNIRQGGLTILTGVLGGLLGVYIATKRHKVAFFDIVDIMVPAILVGQIIGRWGNCINQELYGLLITNPSMQWFPFAVYVNYNGAWGWHCANFFYESLANCFGLILFTHLLKKEHKPGTMCFSYVIWYGMLRGLLEIVKIDQYKLGGVVKGAQLFSFIMAALGLIMVLLIHFDVIKFKTTKQYREKLGISFVKDDVFLTDEELEKEYKKQEKRKAFNEKTKIKIKTIFKKNNK